MRFLTLMAALAMAGACVSIQAAPCLSYEPATVTLSGEVRMVHAYGPPGFGEDPQHDRQGEYAVMDLDAPVCLAAGHGDEIARSAVSKMQVISAKGQKFDPRLLGVHITASGSLWPRESGGVTDVLFDYTDMHPSP